MSARTPGRASPRRRRLLPGLLVLLALGAGADSGRAAAQDGPARPAEKPGDKADDSKPAETPSEDKPGAPKTIDAERARLFFPEYSVAAVGSTRRYKAKLLRGGASQALTVTLTLPGEVSEQGSTWVDYVLHSAGKAGERTTRRRYRVDDAGVWKIDGGLEAVELSFPLRPGESTAYADGAAKGSVCAVGFEDVKIGDKVWKGCLKLVYVLNETHGKHIVRRIITEHRAPGVGMVKNRMELPGREVLVLELDRYTAPGPDAGEAKPDDDKTGDKTGADKTGADKTGDNRAPTSPQGKPAESGGR